MMYKGEKEIAEYLSNNSKSEFTIEDIAEHLKLNIDTVRRAINSLNEKGYVNINKSKIIYVKPTNELKDYLINGFPEFNLLNKNNKSISNLSPLEKRIGLPWAKRKGFIIIQHGKIIINKSIEDKINEIKKSFIANIKKLINTKNNQIVKNELKPVFEELNRRKLIEIKEANNETVKWKGKIFNETKTFDIQNPVENAPIGKNHPITVLRNKIRNVFTSLGFEELEGNIVESAFWNFDALFQPQDHPARELADTFYIDGKTTLPDWKIVSKIKESHETNWKYLWSERVAEQLVLRTHTTAISAKHLGKHKKEGKYFSIGRVFRNEATDSTHLAEFYQVEGIIVWKKANFRHLLGILKSFYKRIGFDKIRFRPSYFPYTEPSLEIEVFFKQKNEWLEMGGAGIFRPEVTEPLCGCYPVLAWGLSLERPLMLSLELTDIRELYNNDAQFLRNTVLQM